MLRLLRCFLIAAALLGGACTSTHRVPRPVSVAELATRADEGSAGANSVAIIYPAIRQGAGNTPSPATADFTFTAPLVRFSSDAVLVATPGQPTQLSLPEVRGYAVTRRGRGGLEGAAIGATVGALTGVLLGVTGGSDPGPERSCTSLDGGSICTTTGGTWLSAGEKEALVGTLLGVSGAVFGAFVGLLVGHTDRFEF